MTFTDIAKRVARMDRGLCPTDAVPRFTSDWGYKDYPIEADFRGVIRRQTSSGRPETSLSDALTALEGNGAN